MSITDFESRLQEQLKKLVADHLTGFEQEVVNAQQAVEQAIQNGFARVLESASKGLNNLAIDNSISDIARETASAAEAALIAAQTKVKDAVNLAPLKAAFRDIQSKRTQAEALSALVSQVSGFAPRVVLFIVKGGNAISWTARGFAGEQNEVVRGFTVSLQSNTVLATVLGMQQSYSGEPETQSENNLLFEKFITKPSRIACVPLIVRNKAAAVLYTDSGSLESDSINLDAVEILVGIAAIAIELISVRPRTAEAATAALSKSSAGRLLNVSSPGQLVAQAVLSAAQTVQPAEVPPLAPEPPPSPAAAFLAAPPVAPAEEPPAPAVGSKPEFFDAPSTVATPPTLEIRMSTSDSHEPSVESSFFEAEPVQPLPPPAETLPPPAEASPYDAAFFQSSAPSAPPNEEEQKQHNDAKRFARLLVSEIKLYNEQKVLDGRKNGDLYDRLKEDIDRSRQMYDKRVNAVVASKFDYFYGELVNSLAEGDMHKLGRDCPGPSLADLPQE